MKYLKQYTRVGVHIGPGVLDLAQLCEDWWHHLVDGSDQLEERVVRQMLQGEFALACVPEESITYNIRNIIND